MEIQNAFDLVADKVEKALAEQDYKRQNVDSQNDKEITALYTSEDTAYNIVYYKAKMRMVLRQCEMSGAEPDNNWKSVATWLFDPEVDTEKEADNIASDFIETIQGPKQQAITQTRKKKKKDNDGNVDSLFLANRMVNYFPELKEDIAYEKLHYANFRGITFAKEKILPLFKKYVENEGANNLEKLSKSLNDIYNMGDLDVKGIISYILFNSIEDEKKREMLLENFTEANKKVIVAAFSLRGKKIKPEKPKKKRSGMFMEALEAKQQAGKQYNLCVSYNLTYAFLFKFVILSIDCIILLR